MKNKAKYILLIFAIMIFSCNEKGNYDPKLKTELRSIFEKDQGFRELFGGNVTETRKNELLQKLGISEYDFRENERELFKENDSINLLRIESIIKKYGYPGKSMVGEPENETVWFVIQHSNKIDKYFPLIKKAGKNGELDPIKVAMMEDRMLMYQGKEQLYGSQGKTIFLVWPPTKQEDGKMIIWPIKNPDEVNQLRKKIGFKSTIEEYAESLNIRYEPFTLSEVNEMNAEK